MNLIPTEIDRKEKIFTLFQTFTPQETQRFILFLKSPYYNQNELLLKLYAAIRTSIKLNQFEAKKIWNTIYPAKKLNVSRYHKLLFELNQLAELFINLQLYNQHASLKQAYFLKAFNQRGLDKQYLFAVQKIKNITQQKTNKNTHDFLHQYLIEIEHNEYLERGQSRSEGRNLEKVMQSLDDFYLFNKLQNWCAILHYKTVNSVEVPVKFDVQLLEYLKQSHHDNDDLIQAYYFILLSLMHPDEESYFKKQKSLLKLKSNRFSVDVLRNLYLYAINYCIRKIVAGKVNYYEEIFELYKTLIPIISADKKQKLSPWDYKNITTVAIRLKEFNWAEKFILDTNYLLPKAEQHNALNYNLAKIFFEKKQFDSCLKQLLKVDFNDVFYLLDTKITQIKTLYELNEYEPLESLLKSFKLLLKRKKIITQQHRIVYTNFANYVIQLMKKNDPIQLQKIKSDISNLKEIVDAKWLLEKIENKKSN